MTERPISKPLRSDDVLYFLHVPKTAGVSLIDFLQSHFDPTEYGPHLTTHQDLIRTPRDQLNAYRLIYGHTGNCMHHFIDRQPVVITMMRQPIDLLLSMYTYIRYYTSQRHPNFVDRYDLDIINRGIIAFFEHYQVTNPQYAAFAQTADPRNHMPALATQGEGSSASSVRISPSQIQDAKSQMDRFAFIGITERFAESLHLLCYTLGWHPPDNVPRLNENQIDKPNFDQLEPKIQAALMARTAADMELYDYGLRLFDSRVLQMKAALKRTAAGTKSFAGVDPADPSVAAPAPPVSRFRGLPVSWEPVTLGQPDTGFPVQLHGAIDRLAVERGTLFGQCNIAEAYTRFRITGTNLRENVLADVSDSYNRQRQLVCAISLALLGHPYASLPEIAAVINHNRLTLYTAEANGVLFSAMRRLIDRRLFNFSEYFGSTHAAGEIVDGVPNEDLQSTSFQDGAFDIVLTSDVLEHVPDAIAAEREIVRVIKPGGVYCFTVPLMLHAAHDDVRTVVNENGTLSHLAPPEYHGDPIRAEGALVFRIFSHADLHRRFTDMGCALTMYRIWSKSLGILGQSQVVCIVRKPSTHG